MDTESIGEDIQTLLSSNLSLYQRKLAEILTFSMHSSLGMKDLIAIKQRQSK